MSLIARGFRGRRKDPAVQDRLPPGQYLVNDFPVLSAGPTPYTPKDQWDFSIVGKVDQERRWTWDEFLNLRSETIKTDIHCWTRWSKLDTIWRGVSVDTLLKGHPEGARYDARYVLAFCDGGYTTNLPLEDVTGGKAWIVYAYGGEALPIEHGGPARLLVPHRYLWKSAKWVRGLELQDNEEHGFWESLGYHDHGDPWLEQRYRGD